MSLAMNYHQLAALDLTNLLRNKRVVICVGAGGVGKTTVSALLAITASRLGRRTLAVTIDPAKRLADALGVSGLGDRAKVIEPRLFAEAGLELAAPLEALILDMKRTWDELIAKHSPSPEAARRIMENKYYYYLSTTLAGSQEYMALEKLFSLVEEDRHELIVLDTPPSANALDFLEAPQRIINVLAHGAVRWLTLPYALAARGGFGGAQKHDSMLLRHLARFTGSDMLRDLAEFLIQFQELYAGFSARARRVQQTLAAPSTAFLCVASPQEGALREAAFLQRRLGRMGYPFAGFVVNRVRQPPPPGRFSLEQNELAAQLDQCLPGANPDLSHKLADAMLMHARLHTELAAVEWRRICTLSEVSPTGGPFFLIPRYDEELHTIARLCQAIKDLNVD